MTQSVNSIPAFDIKQQYTTIEAEVSTAVLEVLASGRYIGGPLVEGFEQQFAAYTNVLHCISCNSGTDALYLALRACNISAEDEVITTPFTFIATAEVISTLDAKPVFVDIDPTTFNLDIKRVGSSNYTQNQGNYTSSLVWAACGYDCTHRGRKGTQFGSH